MSPDLTRNDKAKQGKSGGPITTDITGVEVYDTIFALAESPHETGVLWAGSRRRPGPRHARRRQDLAERHAEGDARSGSRSTRSTSRRTTRARPTSRRRCTSSTTSSPTCTRRPTTARPGRRSSTGFPTAPSRASCARTRSGAAFSTPAPRRASTSPSTTARLAAVPAQPAGRADHDLTVKNGDLVVATQGRSFWILDDLTPLRLWNDRDRAGGRASLPAAAGAPRPDGQAGRGGRSARGVGTNMPNGVLVHYWLKEKPGKDENVKLEILSGDKVIRSFSSEKKEPEGDLKEQAEKKELEKEQGQAARAEGGHQPLRLGHAGLQADARAEGRLQRGGQVAAEGRAGDVQGPADRRRPGRSPSRSRSGRTRTGPRRPRT